MSFGKDKILIGKEENGEVKYLVAFDQATGEYELDDEPVEWASPLGAQILTTLHREEPESNFVVL